MAKNITAGTVARFVLLLVALINTALNMAGVQTIPVNSENVELFINLAFMGGTSLWAYWRNNDVTKKARSK